MAQPQQHHSPFPPSWRFFSFTCIPWSLFEPYFLSISTESPFSKHFSKTSQGPWSSSPLPFTTTTPHSLAQLQHKHFPLQSWPFLDIHSSSKNVFVSSESHHSRLLSSPSPDLRCLQSRGFQIRQESLCLFSLTLSLISCFVVSVVIFLNHLALYQSIPFSLQICTPAHLAPSTPSISTFFLYLYSKLTPHPPSPSVVCSFPCLNHHWFFSSLTVHILLLYFHPNLNPQSLSLSAPLLSVILLASIPLSLQLHQHFYSPLFPLPQPHLAPYTQAQYTLHAIRFLLFSFHSKHLHSNAWLWLHAND